MKPQAVSAVLHATAFAALVLLVKSEARVPTAVSLFFAAVPAVVEPPPRVPEPLKAALVPSRVARASRTAPVAVATTSARPPLVDLGLLALDPESGDAPSSAVVMASGGVPGGVEEGRGGVSAPLPSKPTR